VAWGWRLSTIKTCGVGGYTLAAEVRESCGVRVCSERPTRTTEAGRESGKVPPPPLFIPP
jgi:hypothetical protein